MNLSKTLEQIGFRDVEAKTYLAALELGEATAADIAKKAHLKRPSTYVILKDMLRRGLVSSYSRRGVARFVAQNPKALVETALERAKGAATALPEFEALLKSGAKTTKPGIRYFEGREGIVAVMEDALLTGNKIICAWANIELAWKTLADYYPTYIKRKNERGVFVRAILEDNPIGRLFKERGYIEKRDVVLVPHEDCNMANEINIYDDKISIISHEDLVGVVIQNQKIADTQRAIFEMSWRMLQQTERK